MKESDAKEWFKRPDASTVFEKRLLDFTIDPEVTKKQQVIDFSNHCNAM
jgi:hypothetical protein